MRASGSFAEDGRGGEKGEPDGRGVSVATSRVASLPDAPASPTAVSPPVGPGHRACSLQRP